ncbi:MAG TPA: ABC transporter permease [Bacteroidales bacterium]|nr:ABC transporter permease [Bacteroidales bacterium]HPS16261.1 ABC transporter permease [Bacteroidales bacterium]
MKINFYRKKNYDGIGSLSAIAFRKFRKDKLSMFMFCLVMFAVIIAIAGYLITPDSTPFANAQHIEIAAKNPGFTIPMLKVEKNQIENKTNFFNTMLYGKESDYVYYPLYSWHFEGANIITEDYSGDTPNDGTFRSFNIADVIYSLSDEKQILIQNDKIKFITIDGVLHEEKISDLQKEIINKNIIDKTFLFGTDKFGRDVLSQLIIGTRVSLSVGFISVIISLIVGIFLGALAGFFRGWIDNLIVWLINVVWSIPTLLLVIAITFALGKGFWQVFIAVGLTMWVDVARVVRGQIFSIREKEFVEAGRALGYRNSRIIFRHILPNVMGPVIVISAANFSASILMEAGLSFLGIGVQPPMPSWGTMIKEHYAYIILNSAHLAILPGIAIMLMVLAFMIIGNGLRDALDTRSVDK